MSIEYLDDGQGGTVKTIRVTNANLQIVNGTGDIDPGPIGYVFLFFGYMIITFVGQFFTAAIVAGAHERMTGGDPTVTSALRGAGQRFHRLLPWALITRTVGLVLSALDQSTQAAPLELAG